MVYRCSKCKRELQKFEQEYVKYGVVEKKDDCKDCDYVDASNLLYCIECGEDIKEP
ncbi:MAG: hypothetical protein PWQ67_1369 [Clostridia bacterium]|nr:hypothetical protein [Clostridia bacterium]MDN5322915.1 hypothetical protein [Clostridia bacterium]